MQPPADGIQPESQAEQLQSQELYVVQWGLAHCDGERQDVKPGSKFLSQNRCKAFLTFDLQQSTWTHVRCTIGQKMKRRPTAAPAPLTGAANATMTQERGTTETAPKV